jgi:hypothetical protein
MNSHEQWLYVQNDQLNMIECAKLFKIPGAGSLIRASLATPDHQQHDEETLHDHPPAAHADDLRCRDDG